ncbi:MAG: HDOD domain-containing protein [candidate division Zixibacteria bacterium]|nr:HDOD domain-containing protein [candidate division Zixibacteria bacterium]
MLTEQTISPEEKLRRRLSSITNLPTPPVVFNQITRIINNPKTSVNEIASIMSEDAAMSAKVLRLSNSAFYGARSEITGIKQAVLVLGLEAIKSLVLSSSVFDMFKSHKLDPEYQENYWRHSLATALAGRIVARYTRQARGIDPEVAFSAGLLHDIGKLISCCFLQEEHKLIAAYLKENRVSDYQAEMAAVGHAHTLVGRMLAASWRLPQPIQRAIEFHHFPFHDDQESRSYSLTIHVANYVAKRAFVPRLPEIDGWDFVQAEVLAELEITEEILQAFCEKLLEEYTHSSTFMQLALAS